MMQSVAKDWGVEAMPTFMFLKEGRILDKVVGAKKEELQQTVAKHLATASAWFSNNKKLGSEVEIYIYI